MHSTRSVESCVIIFVILLDVYMEFFDETPIMSLEGLCAMMSLVISYICLKIPIASYTYPPHGPFHRKYVLRAGRSRLGALPTRSIPRTIAIAWFKGTRVSGIERCNDWRYVGPPGVHGALPSTQKVWRKLVNQYEEWTRWAWAYLYIWTIAWFRWRTPVCWTCTTFSSSECVFVTRTRRAAASPGTHEQHRHSGPTSRPA